MTSCPQTERVAEYALRALPESERSSFEAHLRGCAECRQELAGTSPVVAALVDWPTDVSRPSEPLWERLSARIGGGGGAASATPAEPEGRWADAPEWKEVAPGISCKVLSHDATTGMASLLVRLAPNTAYPPHVHAGVEELHLLAGELWIEDRKLHPGDYNRGEPGTRDIRVFSETGCTCVLLTSLRDKLG